MAGQIQGNEVVPAHNVGRLQHRRSSRQFHNVIGQRWGHAVSVNSLLACEVESLASFIRDVAYHVRLPDDHAAGFAKLGQHQHCDLVTSPVYLRVFDAHATPE